MACVHVMLRGEARAVAAVNGVRVALGRGETRRDTALKVACVAVLGLAVAVTLSSPSVARADTLDDIKNAASGFLDAIGGGLNEAAKSFFGYTILALANGCLQVASMVVYWVLHLAEKAGAIIGLNDFDHLVTGGAEVSALKTVAEATCNGVVKPLCGTVLSLIMLSRLMKMSQRIDGTQAMPAVKEVLILAVEVGFAAFLVNQAFPLCSDLFNLINGLSSKIVEQSGIGWINFNVDVDAIKGDGDAWGTLATGIVLLVLGFTMMRTCIGCTIEMYKAFIGRGLQIYLYAAFSPLLMCFFWVDDTRQWALGFVKGFAACALSGVVVYFAMCALPYALVGIAGAAGLTQADGGITVNVATTSDLFALVGISAGAEAVKMLISNSGQYARDILGG